MQHNKTIHDPRALIHLQGLKFYTPLAMLFVSLLIIVNIVAQKIVPIGFGLILTPADFVYPLSYAVSIILTEVYGYAMSRRIIWSGLACNLLVAAIIIFAINLPAASDWHDQGPFALILGRSLRIVLASFCAFAVGEFTGTFILAKIKIFTSGKYLWFRTIDATLIGQAIDSIIFTLIAFAGVLEWHDLLWLGCVTYVSKFIYQLVMTPGIYALARFLKTHEHVDIYDRHTNFNPFNLGLK